MGAAFPLTPVPSWYVTVTPGAAHGVFYVAGTAPFVTLSKTGATSYSVVDYYGNTVSSGTPSGLTLTPTAPSGGWKPGWYRLYLTGPNTDTNFGTAYGSSCFCVLRSDSRFPALTSGGTDADLNNLPARASLGLSTARQPINTANNPAAYIATAQAGATASNSLYTVPNTSPYYDSARTRYLWTNFPAQTWDVVAVGFLNVYCKDGTVDGSTVTVTATAGSSSGTKITINTETYDNLANVAAAVTALNASAFVRGYSVGTTLANIGATVIGNAYFNGVKTTVSSLYPYGVTRFEGPINEPAIGASNAAEVVHQMQLFQAAVHAGNAAAIAIGPCFVSMVATAGDKWDLFLAAGGGAYCDEFSFHAYNATTNGDLNLGRTSIAAFQALISKYGYGAKTLWQTEATQVMTSVYGVYHPRRSRVPILQTLLWEQNNVPRERNVFWYDVSHGFWSFPSWFMMGDDTLNPVCVLYRVLAEETFGQTYTSAFSFGPIGDRIFLGSLYTAPGGTSTAVLMSTSAMPGATLTFTVTGTTAALTVVDGLGNSSTVTPDTNKRITVSVGDIPTYVRLPAGVTLAPYRCNSWPAISNLGWQSSTQPNPPTVTGTISPAQQCVAGQWIQAYTGSTNTAKGTTMPDTVTLTWPSSTRLDRVLIWCGSAWQSESTLTDFDVQTSVDGTTWVTQTTVTKTGVSSFLFGASSTGTGCQRETFWDEQWVFDVALPVPVTCKAIRLNARASSYGGEPDAAAVTTGGQGNTNQFITLQQVLALCDNNVTDHYATIT